MKSGDQLTINLALAGFYNALQVQTSLPQQLCIGVVKFSAPSDTVHWGSSPEETEYEYKQYLGSDVWPNTDTNIIFTFRTEIRYKLLCCIF